MRIGKHWHRCHTDTFMNGKLDISVYDEHHVMIEYKQRKFILPEELDTLYNDILIILDYKEDVAGVVYGEIEKRVNEMLHRYCLDNGFSECTGFKFPPIPIRATINPTSGLPGAMPSYSDYLISNNRSHRESVIYGQSIQYVTAEEYETIRQEGRLGAGGVYVIIT